MQRDDERKLSRQFFDLSKTLPEKRQFKAAEIARKIGEGHCRLAVLHLSPGTEQRRAKLRQRLRKFDDRFRVENGEGE